MECFSNKLYACFIYYNEQTSYYNKKMVKVFYKLI